MTSKKPIHDFIARESSMQRWRKWTPIGLLTNLFASIGGMAIVGWCAIHFISTFEQDIVAINTKMELRDKALFEKLDAINSTEKNDVLSLTTQVYRCCPKG